MGPKDIARIIADKIDKGFGVYLELEKPWPWDWKACYLEAAEDAAALILALPQGAGVEGWKMVPVEPVAIVASVEVEEFPISRYP